VLFGPQLEAGVGGDDPRYCGQVVCWWREMGGSVETSSTRGTATLANAVLALCPCLGFLALSGAERQSRLKKR